MRIYNTDQEAQNAHREAAARNAEDMRQRIKARDQQRKAARTEKRAFQLSAFND